MAEAEETEPRYTPRQAARNEKANRYYADFPDEVGASEEEPNFLHMPKNDFPRPAPETEATEDVANG